MKGFSDLSKRKQSKELKKAKLGRKKLSSESPSKLAAQKIREKAYKKSGGRTAK